jgi:multifunctional 2-oxoglutarate metabolism enzyme
VGQKRFGLEGGESLIPLLDVLCEESADNEVSDIVMGMAHRGRLNVLSNIMGKSHRQIFGEFEGHIDPDTVQGSGDVKYHLGHAGHLYGAVGQRAWRCTCHPTRPISKPSTRSLKASPAPCRMPYDRGDEGVFPVLPVLMHGDSAFAGQGRRRRDVEPVATARVSHRRHHPRGHQ